MNLASDLARLAPGASKKIIAGIVDNTRFLDDAGINTPIRLRHFFARACAETGGLKRLDENLNYSAQRLTEVWPKRFPTLASAQPFANNPKALANKVYGGRLGNSSKNDDGYNFRGSGILQDTGKVNYAVVEKETGLPVVENPGMLRVFPTALQAATIYWTKHKINALADKNDVLGVCKAVNGGTNGLSDQKAYLAKAEKIWPDGAVISFGAAPAKPAPVPAPAPIPVDPVPVVPDPPSKETVQGVQKRLKDLGYNPGTPDPVKGWDGIAGPLTSDAILSFKNDNSLTPNSTIDEAFLTSLATASPRKMVDARANATESEVAAKVPEANMHWWNKIGALGFGGATAVTGAADYASQATGYLTTVRDFIGDVPPYVWIIGFLVLCGALYAVSQRGATKATEAFRNGDRR